MLLSDVLLPVFEKSIIEPTSGYIVGPGMSEYGRGKPPSMGDNGMFLLEIAPVMGHVEFVVVDIGKVRRMIPFKTFDRIIDAYPRKTMAETLIADAKRMRGTR